MRNRKEVILYDVSESIRDSVLKDAFSTALLAFLIRMSQGSIFWEVFTGGMFLIFVAIRMEHYASRTRRVFTNSKTLTEHVESIRFTDESA